MAETMIDLFPPYLIGKAGCMHHIYTKKKFLGFVFPMFFMYTLLFVLPLILAFVYSFTTYDGISEPVWNNFRNYRLLLTDKLLVISFKNTMIMAVMNLVLSMPISFFLALAMSKTTPKNTFYKTVLFAPYVIPGTISGLIWLFMLDPTTGLINSALRAIGLDQFALQWIGGPTLSPYAISVVCVWGGLGYYMVLWQLGIKNIPGDVLEASLIDGCTKWQQITKVTLPMLKDTIFVIAIFILTGALKIYDQVYILTGGGPNHYSESMVSYMYATTFTDRMVGYGMSIAVVEFILAVGITLVLQYFSKRNSVDL